MFLHTHVYYANRFEPGVLFPDTIRLSYENPMTAPDIGRILDFRLEFNDAKSLDPTAINLSVTEENSFKLVPTYGYIALYYVGAPEDFDLSDMIDGYTAVTVTYVADIDLPMQSDDFIGHAPMDFILTDVSESDYEYQVFTFNISQVYHTTINAYGYTEQPSDNKGAVDMGSMSYPTSLSAVDPNVITPSAININIVIS